MANEEIKNTQEREKEKAAKEQEAVETAQQQSAEEKLNELNDKYLRLYSEFDNFRKRTAKERMDLFKTAGQDIISDLLPVLDDFERAMKSIADNTEAKPLREGLSLVHNKLLNTLQSKGLKAFESKEKPFDPDFHEAVSKIPAPSKKLRGKVVDELEKGYLLHDKVIRFAKVVVGE